MDQFRETAVRPVRQGRLRPRRHGETAEETMIRHRVRRIVASGVGVKIDALTDLEVATGFLDHTDGALPRNERPRRRHPLTQWQSGHVRRDHRRFHPDDGATVTSHRSIQFLNRKLV